MPRRFILTVMLIVLPFATAHAVCERERARELYESATAPGVEHAEQIRLLEYLLQECDSFAASFALGRAYAQQNDLLRSISTLRKAYVSANSNEEKARVLHVIAWVQAASKEPTAALLSYKTSLRLAWNGDVERDMLALERSTQQAILPAQQIVATLYKGLQERAIGVMPAVDVRVHFNFDSAALTIEGERQAAEIGHALTAPELQGQRFRLIGHTDSRGDAAYNERLSYERALVVRQYVLAKFPTLTQETVVVEGRGKRELLYRATTEEAHALSRRVEVRVE